MVVQLHQRLSTNLVRRSVIGSPTETDDLLPWEEVLFDVDAGPVKKPLPCFESHGKVRANFTCAGARAREYCGPAISVSRSYSWATGYAMLELCDVGKTPDPRASRLSAILDV